MRHLETALIEKIRAENGQDPAVLEFDARPRPAPNNPANNTDFLQPPVQAVNNINDVNFDEGDNSDANDPPPAQASNARPSGLRKNPARKRRAASKDRNDDAMDVDEPTKGMRLRSDTNNAATTDQNDASDNQ